MPSRARIVIVADDLSSATDCGVRMASSDLRIWVPLSDTAKIPEEAEVIGYDTNSRALSPSEAYDVTARCLEDQQNLDGLVFFKSIDSTLRGNLGAEVDAILDSGRFRASIIAPAFPDNGRTTLNGEQFVHGVPVNETEFGSDPTSPVTSPAVLDRFSEQSSRRGAVIALTEVRGEMVSLAKQMEHHIASGVELLVCDAETEQDLDRLARVLADYVPDLLWVGSTGWARYLPRAIGLSIAAERPVVVDLRPGPIVIVAGTASVTTRQQLDRCIDCRTVHEVIISTRALAAGGEDSSRELSRARELFNERLLAGSGVIALTLTATRGDVSATHEIAEALGVSSMAISASLAERLAALVVEVVDEHPNIASLVLTGGDTANAVARALGVEAIEIVDEIEPGVPLARAVGLHSMLLVTKAGGFGDEESLVRILERLGAYP